MTTAVRVRHTNRTGLRHLSAIGARRQEDAASFGYPERRASPPVAARQAATTPQAALRRSGRHDLLPVGPGRAVCTEGGCVLELHVYVDAGCRSAGPRSGGPVVGEAPPLARPQSAGCKCRACTHASTRTTPSPSSTA